MEFKKIFNKTALYNAVNKENLDIIKLLCSNENIDVNIIYEILNYSFKLHSINIQFNSI